MLGWLTAPVHVRDDTVWDGATRVATIERATGADDTMMLQLVVPVVGRDAARDIVGALTAAGLERVDVADELVRFEARAAGWTGPLRGPLQPGDAATASPVEPEPIAAVGALLAGADVRRHGFGRRVLAMRATAADGLRMRVKLPERDDLAPELVARALDTGLAIRRRFGRMASGVHTIVIDDGAGTYDDHTTAGSAQSGSGSIFLDTSLAFADAIVAQRRRMAGRVGVSATVPPPFAPIDGVLAHEYWHNLDATVAATPAVYVEINRALGAELGVDTYEHALRGGETGAPAEWQAARLRIAREVSLYALTNSRESTAELFKLWWCSTPATPPSPLVACFGALLDRFYPAA